MPMLGVHNRRQPEQLLAPSSPKAARCYGRYRATPSFRLSLIMASYTYQHYIPAGHQALFSDGRIKNFVCKYDCGKSIIYSRLQNPKNHGGKNHLYSFPSDLVLNDEQKTYLETHFFSQDGQFVGVVKKIMRDEPISENDVYQIIKYIAGMKNRHPSTIKSKEKDVTQSALEFMFGGDSKMIELFKSEGVRFVPKSEGDFVQASSLNEMLNSFVANLHDLCDISMNILVSDNEEFILSDRPFVGMKNGSPNPDTDNLSSDTDYFLPLSKNICVHLNGSGQHLNGYYIDEARVRVINKLQIASAKEFVIASSVSVLKNNLDEAGVTYVVQE